MDELLLPVGLGCLVALLSALGVIIARRPVHGAVALLVHSASVAALYLLLSAELVAIGQLLIYSGAIVVLFLFVVALLPSGGVERAADSGKIAAALVGSGAVLAALAAGLSTVTVRAPAQMPSGVEPVGRLLFGQQIVAFELTALLLLVAIVGAVTIWRRGEEQR